MGSRRAISQPGSGCGTCLQGDTVGVAWLQLGGEISIHDVLQALLEQQQSSCSHLTLCAELSADLSAGLLPFVLLWPCRKFCTKDTASPSLKMTARGFKGAVGMQCAAGLLCSSPMPTPAGWMALLPLQPCPYLGAWVLVGPEGSVSHDDPVSVQGQREGLWPPQPSPSGRVLDLRNALSDQSVQILNVLQDQIEINLGSANNAFTCGRGIRVTGEGVVAPQISLCEFEVCLSPDIFMLCPSHVCRMWCNVLLCHVLILAKPQGQGRGCSAGAAGSELQSSSWSPHSAPGLC